MLSGISQQFHHNYYAHSVLPLCLHYAPRLATFLMIIFKKTLSQQMHYYSISLQSGCSIREYQSKEMCTMHLSAYCSWQFTLTTVLDSINLKYPPNMHYAGIAPRPIMHFIMLAYFMQAY